MTSPLTIHFIRHGDVHNPDNILYGRLPGFFLSKMGREQAISAGQALKDQPIHAIYASPMERTQETARLLVEQRANPLDVVVDERLIEVHTPLDGTPHPELEPINHDLYTGNEPPYEQPQDIRARLLDFIAEMRRQHANQRIIAVTHGDIVVSAFMHAKEQDANDIGRSRTQTNRIQQLGLPEMYPATASISTLSYQTDDPDEVPTYQYLRPY